MNRLAAFSPAGKTLADSVPRAKIAEKLGYESIWTTQLPTAREASLVLAAYSVATDRIKLGTGVLPIYTRHPTAMVQMAATLDEMSGGRFILGIGVSHKVTVETMWGLQLQSPVDAMREYLTIVRTSLRDGACSFEGRFFSANWAYLAPHRPNLPVMISALNPRMLELAGELADGVVLYMCAPSFIDEHVIPAVRAGREKAGKSMEGFEVVAAVDACVTSDRDAAHEVYQNTLDRYSALPYYRRAMEASDFKADELAAIGDEQRVRDAVRRFLEAGVTLPAIGPFGGHAAAGGFEATLAAAAAD
jgi:F420-dependent oxidoreductase-like protein